MKNLLVWILSFVICLGLLVGGILLTVQETMDNMDDISADWQDVVDTPWLPGLETPNVGDEIPEGAN